MPSVRLSSEALNFLRQTRNQNAVKTFKPIVSIVQDDEESDVESEGEEVSAVVLTPRLKAHTRKVYNLPSDEPITGGKTLQPAPVSNLSKRFSSTSLNTPSRILQLALERKSSSEGHGSEKNKEPDVSSSDTDTEVRHSRKEVSRQQSPAEANKKSRPTRRKANKEQLPEAVSDTQEEEFKVPQQTKRKKKTDLSEKQASPEKQPKATRRRGKKKEREEADVPQIIAASDDSEPQATNVSSKRPRRGQRGKGTPRNAKTTAKSPSALTGVQVTVENVPTVSGRRDVLLLNDAANDPRNTKSIDDTIDSVLSNVVENHKSPEKSAEGSRKRKKAQEVADESIDNVGYVTTRRGRTNKETPPVKRPVRNNRTRKAASRTQEEDKEDVSNEKPEDVDGEGSTSTIPVVPDFSSDHEEDRSATSSPSRDSPIITKSDRLSRVMGNKSPSYDESSDSESSADHKLSTVPSRSSSSSPDMFSPSPRVEEPAGQNETRAPSQSEKPAPMQPDSLDSSIATRARRRANVGVAAKPSLAPSTPLTSVPSDQTTPLQLEAVGLVRKPTPQSARAQTPPRKSLPPTVTTPLSSRNRNRAGPESQVENDKSDQEKSDSLKRKQGAEAPNVTPKRQRVQKISREVVQEPTTLKAASPLTRKRSRSISPTKKVQKSTNLEAQMSPVIAGQRTKNLTQKKAQEPASLGAQTSSVMRLRSRSISPEKLKVPPRVATPRSASTRQRTQNSAKHFPEPPNINTEETLLCTVNTDFPEIASIGIGAISSTSRHSKLPHTEECTFEQTIAKRTNISGNSSSISLAVQPNRFNAYSANPDDPVRATQLLANDEYRVSWLHILPNCSFYFRVRAPTVVMVISGVLQITGDSIHPRGLMLNSKSRVAELNIGSLCQAVNIGEMPAIFQVTESLS